MAAMANSLCQPDRHVNNIIEKTLSMLENEFRLHHIRVEKLLSSEMPDILVDVNQMHQVFVNLLLNAVEAIQDQGTISIRSEIDPAQRCVRVETADTGRGIPPENISKVFEPFFTTKAKGTGLGLSVSYRIIWNHQGDIKVSSQPGQGARFTIEIPLLQNAPSKETKGQPHGTQ